MMASSCRKSEIVEVKDKNLLILNNIPTKYLENDINKLFEAVNLRTSKSLDLSSDSWRNSSKKPMRTHSPGIGFSDPVSLKQALRGLSISQAAEMAAVKRLSMASASPRISEVCKITNPSLPVSQSGHSSPRFVSSVVKDAASSLSHKNNVPISDAEAIHKSNSTSGTTPVKITDITTSNPKPKSRLQNVSSYNSGRSNEEIKLTKKITRVRSVKRKKNIVIKKPMKLALATRGNSKEPYEANRAPDLKQLTCERCQCSLKGASMCDSLPITPAVKIINNPSKSRDKGDISQSSKSSICDFSSSTTSFSEDSNLSSSTGSRPHMSKDVRWKAIERVRKQYGFMGLRQFNLLKKLGAGDIGTVYLAELVGTSCPFAIKVMDNEELGKRKKTARAQTDRDIIGMLDHPFLPTLYSQFTSDNLSCLVMEFCPGGDLHVLRQKQPGRFFSEHAARFYAAEVLLALEYLHMLGIIYRDLKPENILVREDGHIMLTDFDLSLRCSVNPTILKSSTSTQIEPPRISGQCTGSNCIDPFCSGPSCQVPCFSPRLLHKSRKPNVTQAHSRSLPQLVAEPTEARSNSFVGTHEYLAPEIIKCEGHGSAVDWWTFGVFLYELLYGKTPFKGPCTDETLANVVMRKLRFPNTQIVSSQARDLIRGLLVKNPENRLGYETGAAEIKRHPFFEGLNWALVRCAIPPHIPEQRDVGKEKAGYNVDDGRHVEFELF